MMSTFLVPVLFAVLVLGVAGDSSTLRSFYQFAAKEPTLVSLLSSTIFSQNSGGAISGASVNIGYRSSKNLYFMTDSVSFRTNTLSELYVSVAIQQLMATGSPALSSSTLPNYMPKGVSLVNNGVTITLQMLLQHQSGLLDSGFVNQNVEAPTQVLPILTFCENYFTTNSGGTFVQTTSTIFGGLTGNFSYSRMNTVLLTCILERYVEQHKPTLKSGPFTAASYIQNNVFNTVGLANTFTVNRTGAFPLSTFPLEAPIYSNSIVEELNNVRPTINPGYSADYMYFTSAADLAIFVRATFINLSPEAGDFARFGATMKTAMPSLSFTPHQPAVTGQTTYSLYTFSGLEMCKIALQSLVISSCPLTSSSFVFGYMARGRFSSLGFFCTSAQSVTSPTCVSVHFSHFDVSAAPSAAVIKYQYDMILGMAAVAFTESIGSPQLTLLVAAQSKQSDLYGLYVFLAVSGIIASVLVASYVTEYLVQPAPIATGMPPPLQLPQHLYAQPPLPRHDFYAQ